MRIIIKALVLCCLFLVPTISSAQHSTLVCQFEIDTLLYPSKDTSKLSEITIYLSSVREFRPTAHKEPEKVKLHVKRISKYPFKEVFTNLDEKVVEIDAVIPGIGSSHVRNIFLTKDSVTSLTIKFPGFCSYDLTKPTGICPFCNKKDKAIPIIYGLATVNGKNGRDFIQAGCPITNCDPQWYCKREKKTF